MNQFYNGIILSCAFISFSKAQAQQKVSEEILHYFDQKLLFIENCKFRIILTPHSVSC